jgi:hypothetical protein
VWIARCTQLNSNSLLFLHVAGARGDGPGPWLARAQFSNRATRRSRPLATVHCATIVAWRMSWWPDCVRHERRRSGTSNVLTTLKRISVDNNLQLWILTRTLQSSCWWHYVTMAVGSIVSTVKQGRCPRQRSPRGGVSKKVEARVRSQNCNPLWYHVRENRLRKMVWMFALCLLAGIYRVHETWGSRLLPIHNLNYQIYSNKSKLKKISTQVDWQEFC